MQLHMMLVTELRVISQYSLRGGIYILFGGAGPHAKRCIVDFILRYCMCEVP